MSSEPLRAIEEAEIATFETDGATALPGMIDGAWIEVLRAGVARNLAEPTPLHTTQTSGDEPGYFLSDICMAQHIPEFREFLLNGPVPAMAARLMRARRVNFFADTLWVKDPGTTKRTRWHQDQAFFWVAGRQMCVIWFPLDAIDQAHSLELVRGSHRWGKWFGPELSKDGRDLYSSDGGSFDRMPDIEADRAGYDIASWAVEPGDCIAFHGATVHGAPGAPASGRRRAFSSVWMGEDARYCERPSAGRPHFEGHGLVAGQPMDSPYFPRLWPRAPDTRYAAEDFARFTDPGLVISN